MNTHQQTPPDALIFVTSECPHCPAMLTALTELIKDGSLGMLHAINIATHPEEGEKYQVQSVPWLRIGKFILTGLRSKQELYGWARRANSITGIAFYFEELLKAGNLDDAIAFVKSSPSAIEALLLLSSDTDTDLNIRIGISAIFEALAGQIILSEHMGGLLYLSENENSRVRVDACHFLSLTNQEDAAARLNVMLNDEDNSVREAASESLSDMKERNS